MTTTAPQTPTRPPLGWTRRVWRRTPSLVARLWRGRAADPAWVRPALLTLLAGTAVLYLWGLGASGWANSFYAAAAQAGANNWTAFFFGSSDAANFITVDKTPAFLWPMELSARVFGVNAWSILVPQALEGIACVGVLYATVRRRFPPQAGLLAGAVLALTPVAVLMFRFDNPDAMLVLLLTLGAYGVLRAQESAHTGWLVFAGACLGSGFLAKMFQAFLVLPAFALVYLVTAPTPVRRRLGQLLLAGGALVASAGWWVAVVALVPAGSRPYVGGSQHDSVLELALGYNGFGRLTGDETGSVGGPPGGGWGETGWDRLFGAEMGGQISWLLPAALALLLVGLWVTRRAGRADTERAAFALWGGWLLTTGAVFSLMRGIIHPYYMVALAPAVAALAGMGCWVLWRRRRHPAAVVTLAVVVAGTALWSSVLLGRTPDWHPWVRTATLVIGVAGAAALLGSLPLSRLGTLGHGSTSALSASRRARVTRCGLVGVVVLALVGSLTGTTAYAIATASTPHGGAIPSAGPATGFGGRPGRPPGGGRHGHGGPPRGKPGAAGRPNGGMPAPGKGGHAGSAPGRPSPGGGRRPSGGGGGAAGGLLHGTRPTAALTEALGENAAAYTWVAATVGSNNAAGYQLATRKPVMAIGGFNGTDPAPTLAEFQRYVAEEKIHYFIAGGMMHGNGGSDVASRITAWVRRNFTSSTVGGTTVYDLAKPAG